MLDALRKLSMPRQNGPEAHKSSYHRDLTDLDEKISWELSHNQQDSPNNGSLFAANYGFNYNNEPVDDATWISTAPDLLTQDSNGSGYQYPVSQYHPLSPSSVTEGCNGKKRRVNSNSSNVFNGNADPYMQTTSNSENTKPVTPNNSYDAYLPPTPHSSVGTIVVPSNQQTSSIPVPQTPLKPHSQVQPNPYSEFTPKTPTYTKPYYPQTNGYQQVYVPPRPLNQASLPNLHASKYHQASTAALHAPAPLTSLESPTKMSRHQQQYHLQQPQQLPVPQQVLQPPQQQPWKPREIVLPRIADTGSKYAGDDEHGHYNFQIGELFAGRYTIMKLLGQGTYGKVLQVWDNRQNEYGALKVIKAIPKYREASKIELRVLTALNQCDPLNEHQCVKMKGCFDYRNHVCILTDLYDISIYDFLKNNKFMPFPGSHVVDFARQLLKSIAHVHSLGLVHTDIKPENMLLASRESGSGKYKRPRARSAETRLELSNTDITLIDFGSSVFHDEYHSSVVSTRHYRAPEVVLGLDWSYPCDLWSIACVLIELCTGRVLFETRDNLEHLHTMQKAVCRKFSAKQLSDAEFANYPASQQLIEWSTGEPSLAPLIEESSINKLENFKSIPQFIRKYVTMSYDKPFWTEFMDLISRLMELNPEKRITAEEALRHPWLAH